MPWITWKLWNPLPMSSPPVEVTMRVSCVSSARVAVDVETLSVAAEDGGATSPLRRGIGGSEPLFLILLS